MTCGKYYNDGVYHQSLSLNWMFILFLFCFAFLFIKVFKVFCVIRYMCICVHLFRFMLENLAFFIFHCKVHLKPHWKTPFTLGLLLLYAIIWIRWKEILQHTTLNKEYCAVVFYTIYFVHFKKMCTTSAVYKVFVNNFSLLC